MVTTRFKKVNLELGQMAHTYNPHNWEVEVGASRIQSQPQLHCKFEASLAIWDSVSKVKNSNNKMGMEAGVWIWRTLEFVIQGGDAWNGCC